jgi:large exoprotein involved in heme utilization and adhesion
VHTSDAVAVDGSKLATETYGNGNGGDLTLETRNLSVLNGGEISTGVFRDSSGQGGKLSVNASNSVDLNGGSLATATLGTGRAGDLTVNTRTFTAEGRGRVEAGTVGLSQGGNVTVNALDSIALSGQSPSGNRPTAISAFSRPPGDVDSNLWSGNANSGGVNLTTKNLVIQEGAQVTTAVEGSSQTGNAGNVQVQADSLDLINGGSITSRSEGQGRAGDISVNLKNNLRSSGGIISATSTQAGGGNINIAANDIRLRNSSLISSSVKDSTGGGGDITINSEIFLALEDSDILANANAGSGGNITIKSPGFLADLFSTGQAEAVGRNPGDFAQFRGNGQVDISAESQTGPSGTVTYPNVDPTRGASELPSNVVNASELIDRRCTAKGSARSSSFTVTGRGGLPPNPNDPLIGESIITNWVTLDSEPAKRDRTARPTHLSSTHSQQLVEAQGWAIGANGQVILTAQANTATPMSPGVLPLTCPDNQTTKE